MTQLNATGTGLLLSTYLGGSCAIRLEFNKIIAADVARDIVLDPAGNLYVAGYTCSSDFPATFGAFQTTNNYNDFADSLIPWAGFVAKLSNSVQCNLSLSSSGQSINTAGGSGSFTVIAPANCGWSVTVDSSWITVTLDANYGLGTSTISFSVTNNISTSPRTGKITFTSSNTQNFTIMEDAFSCGYAIDSPGKLFGPAGGSGTVNVTAAATCNWTAASGATWVTFTSATSGTGNGAVTYSVAANSGVSLRPAPLVIAGQNFLVTEAGLAPTGVFRDINGAIRLTGFGSTTVPSAGGAFASDPALAQSAGGDSFVVARDAFGTPWVNIFSANTQSWGSWANPAGTIQGMPAAAVTPGGTAYFVARDGSNSYWINSYQQGTGFGGWQRLGGVFATDPAIAGAPDGTIYIVSRDQFGAIWSGHYVPGSGFAGYLLVGGVVQGKPSVTAGSDGAAYIAVRDMFNGVWMARVQGMTFTGWQPGGGVVATDPQAADTSGTVFVVAEASGGAVWYNRFTEGTGNNWAGWTYSNGFLQSAAVAARFGRLFITGLDGSDSLWWYDSGGPTWTPIGYSGYAAGPLSAAPR